LCSKCDGLGLVVLVRDSQPKTTICDRCDGRGKYDWIERATGQVGENRPYTKEAENWFLRDMMEFIREKDE